MPAKRKITEPNDERFCPWCETKYHTRSDQTGPLCSDCRGELLEQPKELLRLSRRTAGATQRVSGGHAWPRSGRQRHLNGLSCPKLTRHAGYSGTVECTGTGRVRSSPDHDETICTKAPASPLSSWQRLLPAVALPFCAVFALVVG